jgi:3-oxoacyl-[acyl-carrier protein] reductase
MKGAIMEFKGKKAVVTGSSGGIGRAIAIALAREGADIVLAARNVTNMESVKKEIEALGREAVAIQCDVSRDEDVFAMSDRAIKAYGNIDILVNNAAFGIRGSLEDVSLDDWRDIINTNLMGYVRAMHAFLRHFMERGSGYIVNASSIQALAYGTEMLNTPYVTTKAGITGLTDCLSSYLRPKGIKVSCLIPGGVITERKKELRDRDTQFTRGPTFLTAEQCAEGLIDGMKKEDYLILVPARMAEMLEAQGRDIAKYNAYVANPPPRFPPQK